MKTLRQLFRQPVRTAAGVLTVALAVAILVTSVGQYVATVLTRSNLDDRYDTIALLSAEYFKEDVPSGGQTIHSNLPSVYQEWVDETIQTRTDLVKTESYTQLYSAYVPSLSPDNFSQYEDGDGTCIGNLVVGRGHPYRCAMLEVTLTAVGTVLHEEEVVYFSASGSGKYRQCISVLCTGTVEQVIGLEQGFDSPVGKTITFPVCAYDEAGLEAMELEVGQRYLIYGMDYVDFCGATVESEVTKRLDQFVELYGTYVPQIPDYMGEVYDHYQEQVQCYMTVCNYADFPVLYEAGDVRTDLRKYSQWGDGRESKISFIPAEEYLSMYSVPTVKKLSGTAQDYINSDEGALWKKTLGDMEINNHSFPVLAVKKLGYQVAFARGDARIVDGRDFTEAERTEGAKVCIISETVAYQNGLSVGDCINMQTCAIDRNVRADEKSMEGTCFPSAAFYSSAKGFTSEQEEYQIVGIYRQNNAWERTDDAYGFTPNVIFVPQGSISGDMKIDSSGIFYTLVLENGKMEQFQALQEEAGYPDLFICMDQGYTEIVAGLDAYESVSLKALVVGVGSSVIIMLLFMLLFPCRQSRTLTRMSALGTPRGKRIQFHLASTFYILLLGALLGGIAGAQLWDLVAEALMETVNVQITLQTNMTLLAPCLVVAVVAVVMLATLPVAVLMDGDRGLMKKK